MLIMPNDANQDTLSAYSSYDLLRVTDLIMYFHAAAGYLVRSKCLKTISAGN